LLESVRARRCGKDPTVSHNEISNNLSHRAERRLPLVPSCASVSCRLKWRSAQADSVPVNSHCKRLTCLCSGFAGARHGRLCSCPFSVRPTESDSAGRNTSKSSARSESWAAEPNHSTLKCWPAFTPTRFRQHGLGRGVLHHDTPPESLGLRQSTRLLYRCAASRSHPGSGSRHIILH